MSEANDPAPVSEANDPAPVSEANDPAPVSETNEHVDIHIERGKPSDDEVAALVAVLGAASGGVPEPVVPPRNMWGHPVSHLRYAATSWQRMTLLERTYMRR